MQKSTATCKIVSAAFVKIPKFPNPFSIKAFWLMAVFSSSLYWGGGWNVICSTQFYTEKFVFWGGSGITPILGTYSWKTQYGSLSFTSRSHDLSRLLFASKSHDQTLLLMPKHSKNWAFSLFEKSFNPFMQALICIHITGGSLEDIYNVFKLCINLCSEV